MKLLVRAALATVVLVLAPPAGRAQSAPARTAWGAPDLQGVWNHGTATPLERPERHAGRERLTAAEIAEVSAARRSAEGVGARRVVWWERGLSDGRTSMIVDPTDGPMFEYACHEGNDGMTALLDIARGEEAAAGGEPGSR